MANVIPFPASRVGPNPQPARRFGLPTAPVREAILEAFLECRTEHEIGRNLKVPAAIVREVLRGWQEIHRKQAAMSRVNRPDMQEMFRVVEMETWREVARGPLFPPPQFRKAA